MPLVSVIVPVYNGEKVIARCLESIITQELSDIEIIVINNASVDNTKEIVRKFQKRDKRITLCDCPQKGVSAARNYGLYRATSKFIYFVDSDDYLEPSAVALLCMAAQMYDADVVSSNVMRVGRYNSFPMDSDATECVLEGEEIPRFFYDKLETYIMYDLFKLYRREMLLAHDIRFDEKYSLGEDLVFNIEVYKHAKRVAYVPTPVYNYLMTASGLNAKVRGDFVDIKIIMHNAIKEYLVANNNLDKRYYRVFFNEIFSCLVNERADTANMLSVLNGEYTQEMLSAGIYEDLSFFKKVTYFCIERKIVFMLKIIAGIYLKFL